MDVASLPELAERDAAGEIAEIYAELRASLRVPMVNLVFRHMATVPGCLPWAWACVRPLYLGSALETEAESLAPVVVGSQRVRWTAAPEAVAATLAAYTHANPINLIGLLVLRRALTGCDGPASQGAPVALSPCIAPVLPMPALSEVPAETVATLRRLARALHGEEGPVIPSLFRHFAPWPETLSDIEAVIVRLRDGGTLARAATEMMDRAGVYAARVQSTRTPAAPAHVAQTVKMLAEVCRPIWRR